MLTLVALVAALLAWGVFGRGCSPLTNVSQSGDGPGETVDPADASDTQVGQGNGRTEPPEQVEPPLPTPNEVEVISFDDLNLGMPIDSKFRPIMLTVNDGRAQSLFGKKINVAGYINEPDEFGGLKEFILLRNLECKFGPGGQADHLIHVVMEDSLTAEYTDKIVYVEGELALNPFPEDGPSTWSIYDLKATKVSTKAPPRKR